MFKLRPGEKSPSSGHLAVFVTSGEGRNGDTGCETMVYAGPLFEVLPLLPEALVADTHQMGHQTHNNYAAFLQFQAI